MKPYRIIQGDVLAGLSTLPDASVHCCVTSPPYWGLRDYGTGRWDGGDAACDHRAPSRFDYALKPGLGPTGQQDQTSNAGSGSVQRYRSVCGKCGATRVDDQLGLEPTPAEYVEKMVAVFREVRRVLRDDGTLWLNLGDSYASNVGGGASPQGGASARPKVDATMYAQRSTPPGLKAKDLVGIPWRVAFALQADGWYMRSDIIWAKPNPMPESVTDRPTKAHEYLFLLSKSERYHYDADAISEPAETAGRIGGFTPNAAIAAGVKPTGNMIAERGKAYVRLDTRNKRTVWTIPTEPFPGAHFAVMPTGLVKPCILAGCPTGGTVLDPFTGSGTVAVVAIENGCNFVGCELNAEYVKIAEDRIAPVAAQGNLFHGATS